MRLKLVAKTPMDDPAEKGWRLLERGELTLGRSPACGWTLSDPDRMLSKTHCRIVRDAQGFLLRDESTNGVTVDGVDLVEGQSVRLKHGSQVAFCGIAFATEITGEAEPDWSDPSTELNLGDEPLTITSIISDVAPGGRTAGGLIPGRSGDEWIEAQGSGPIASARAERHADIGWSGPPEPQLLQEQTLPDDWHLTSDVASRSEHMPATSVRVRLPKQASEEEAPPPAVAAMDDDIAETLVAAFRDGAKVPETAPGDPIAYLRGMGRTLRGAMDRLAALEAATAEFLGEHGVEGRTTRAAADPTRLAERLDRLIDDQRLLHEAIGAAFDDVAQRFDPRAIEARVDAKAAAARMLKRRLHDLPLFAERDYWSGYREVYGVGEDAGGSLRVRFRETLRSGDDTRKRNDFEELSADDQKG